jgi:methyltransferase of ATP-grasp peptide maturase system
MSLAARQRRHLVDRLRHEGILRDPAWIEAFRRVPRHVFVPRYFVPEGGRWAAVVTGDERWLAPIYSDSVLVTQLDDDPDRWARARWEGPVTGVPTSSSSMPTIMAVMLEELRVEDGNRVLEIGTGTGYNAALLCHRLGDTSVSTVDVDRSLVLMARAALASIGFLPRCEASDGEQGLPTAWPYDRVLCTCSVSRIPPSWLAQTRPGGLVLTTLNRPIGAGLVRLEAGEGAVGRGQVLPWDGRFMPMRSHRQPGSFRALADLPPPVTRRETTLAAETVLDPASPFEFFVSLEVPGLVPMSHPARDQDRYLLHPDGSWAAHRRVDGHCVVEQGGATPVWDLVERAYERWRELGEPSRERFTAVVAQREQYLALGELRWPLTA